MLGKEIPVHKDLGWNVLFGAIWGHFPFCCYGTRTKFRVSGPILLKEAVKRGLLMSIFYICLKSNKILSWNILQIRPAVTLFGWFFSTNLCTLLHKDKIFLISEKGTIFLVSFFSSEATSPSAVCCTFRTRFCSSSEVNSSL